MREQESIWVGARLAELPPERLSPVLELGSSTAAFRSRLQPHIETHIFAPLRARAVAVVHADQKQGEGIDICGDVFDPVVQEDLAAVGARCLLCCNILEHVSDPRGFAALCDRLLAPGGVAVVTVPFSYPLHQDPIDTYFRPAPAEVAALFPGYETLQAAILPAGSFSEDLWADPRRMRTILRRLASLVRRGRGQGDWRSRNHRLLWLWRPYRVTAVVLAKPAAPLRAAAS